MKRYLALLLICLPFLMQAQKMDTPLPADKPHKPQGYLNFFSFGQYVGSKNDDKASVSSLQMEHNYRFNRYVAFGVVTGVDWYDIAVAPVGANLKLFLPGNDRHTFYAGGSVGHSVPLEEMELEQFQVIHTKGGRFVNAELGYIFPFIRSTKIYLALGYHYQSLSFTREDWWLREVERKVKYNRVAFRVGVKLF